MMKRKVTRLSHKKHDVTLEEKLSGIHWFRITGPCSLSGLRVNLEFKGTRKQADSVQLKRPEARRNAN